ncbi:uncharacterized protein LOC131633451 [Vicia villosa]|uniref:uncharacterized protein LOC131633451 n=1 Tax=Vicia villosa TaxID=3911 RepID=UPI00273AC86E|nr:uncharacterized protein LOC131633451 [Vicia villosa]
MYQVKDPSPIKVAEEALESVMEFNKWNDVKKGEERLRTTSDTSTLGVHFLHVDASFSEEGFMTMGCIIKDHNQAFSLAACRRENMQVEVAVGEAMAVRWGLSLAKDLNLEKIVIKSDAKVVVDCVNGFSKLVALEPVIVDIKESLRFFNFASLLFHSRSCNFQAHNLARLAHFVGSRTWVDEYPSQDISAFVTSASLLV